MKKGVLILSSIIAVAVLICASFSSVASSQAGGSRDMLQRVRERITDYKWYPGKIILIIFLMIVVCVVNFWNYLSNFGD